VVIFGFSSSHWFGRRGLGRLDYLFLFLCCRVRLVLGWFVRVVVWVVVCGGGVFLCTRNPFIKVGGWVWVWARLPDVPYPSGWDIRECTA